MPIYNCGDDDCNQTFCPRNKIPRNTPIGELRCAYCMELPVAKVGARKVEAGTFCHCSLPGCGALFLCKKDYFGKNPMCLDHRAI